jgi:NAD(P)-dependent dehydrogenase (short-subunit alcohol dehydrogenase family)
MTVLITGGTKGIGLAIARRLAAGHGPVILAFHNDEAAAAAAIAEITAAGGEAVTIKADVGIIEGCTGLIAEIERLGRGLTHIVHSAAMIYPTTLLGADLEQFRRATETNGLSLLYLVHAAQGAARTRFQRGVHHQHGRADPLGELRGAGRGQGAGQGDRPLPGIGACAAWDPDQRRGAGPGPHDVGGVDGRE